MLVSGAKNGVVKLWDIDTVLCIRTFKNSAFSKGVFLVRFFNEEGLMGAVSYNDTISFWDTSVLNMRPQELFAKIIEKKPWWKKFLKK